LQASENSLPPSAEKIVEFVNRDVTPKLIRFESFVTACYTRFDLAKSEITFVDCGHTKTIHFDARERCISLLEGENLPLGFSEGEVFVEKSVKVESGDVLFFYSDGVTETKNPEGELFGDLRLKEFISQNAQTEPQKIISTLIETLKEYSNETKFNDDLTCVAVRFGQSS
jgi:phosphoserine phosphatase RsbU/P